MVKHRIVNIREVAKHPRKSLCVSDYVGRYKCLVCGSTDVNRKDGFDERYPNDWSLDCSACGSWEQVGNNRPHSFEEVKV